MTPEEAFLAWAYNADERDTTWMRDAACKGSDPNLFFPGPGEDTRPAQRVCNDCPVRQECADYGIGEEVGIYGGMTGRQRDQLREKYELRKQRQLRRQHGTPTGFHQHERAGEPACQACRLAYRARVNPEQNDSHDKFFDAPILCHRCSRGVHGLCRFCACECRRAPKLDMEDAG